MFHLRASVALWRGKSPARAGRIALIKLRRVARPWALGGLDGCPTTASPPPGTRITHARRVRCVATAGGGLG